MKTATIYLDNCATTRTDPRAVDVMLPYFSEHYGNAASGSHEFGWAAQDAVGKAVSQIAELINAELREIVLTSGATESNNLAISGFMQAGGREGGHVITCVTEHKSVLDTCAHLEEQGFAVTRLEVDEHGRLSLDNLRSAIRPDTLLVSLMMANNETGTAHPVREIADMCRAAGITFHVDATQAAGKLPLDVTSLPVDLISFSGHKLYGPKGIGALYVRRQRPRLRMNALIHGGGHQNGLRSGTLPVPLIVGFGVACEIASLNLEAESQHTSELRDLLESRILQSFPQAIVNSDTEHRSPIVTNMSFPGVDGEDLLTELTGIAASSGSACTSADAKPSYVLSAMGRPPAWARASLRLSVGRFTTINDVERAAELIIDTIASLSEAHDDAPALKTGVVTCL